EEQWARYAYNETYTLFNKFLVLLAARCTKQCPFEKARPAIPLELRAKLSYSRALSFRVKKTGDMRLRNESTCIRNQVRNELKIFRQHKLAEQVKARHKPGPTSM
ncbi:unnamed protein product, partial [Didymodactylos carnosus]